MQAPPIPEPPPSVRDDAQRATSRRWAAWSVLTAFVAAGTYAAIGLRTEVATLFPPAASFYSWVGAPVNIRGIDIKASTSQELANGVPVIVIKGEYINVTDR